MSLHHVNDNIELQRYQNRTISLLTLSYIDHHTYIHTSFTYMYTWKWKVKSVEIQKEEKRRTNKQKRYGNKSM